MHRVLQILTLALIVFVALPGRASADFWARVDRPWSPEELDRAIYFCRLQPQVGANLRLFIDVLLERQIDKCMKALGWIGVAR